MCYFWRLRATLILSCYVRERGVWWLNNMTEVQRIARGFAAGMASFCFAVLILLNAFICYLVSCLITPPSPSTSPPITLKNLKNQTSCFISYPTFHCFVVPIFICVDISVASSVWFFLAGTRCFIPESSRRWREANSWKKFHKWDRIHI